MKLFKRLFILSLISFSFLAAKKVEITDNKFISLCYHDVQDKIVSKDIMTITTDELTSHFKWIKENNYHPISLDDILAAKRGEKALPKNAVLLTFDDGYESFYTRIYPLLKLYNFPAVFGLVTHWLNAPEGGNFTYGSKERSRDMLLTWKEIKEMVDSGLVEMGSHSHNSHYGILANPQGNTQPKYTSLHFDKTTKSYEEQEAYIKRVEADIKESSDELYKHTGVRPRSIIWPYGSYNKITQKIAKKYGMEITLTLDDGVNTLDDLTQIKRVLISNDIKFQDFFWNMQYDDSLIQRPLAINLDDIYDPDPKKEDENLGHMIERILAYGANIVYIKPYSDRDNDGLVDTLYFPNHTMPMRSDLFNRVSWQINSRAHVEKIYAWMPISSFEVDNKKLSIYKESDKNTIKSIFFDMAKYGFLKAILFDDVHMADYHDSTKEAKEVYRSWGLPDTLEAINQHPKFSKNFADFKRAYIVKFTKELAASSRYFTTELLLSRVMRAENIMDAKKAALAPDTLESISKEYDYTVVKAAPYAEAEVNPEAWLKSLIHKVSQMPEGLEKTIFMVRSTYNTKEGIRYLPANLLIKQMNILTSKGALNFGYYPDVPLKDKNKQRYIKHVFSLHDFAFN